MEFILDDDDEGTDKNDGEFSLWLRWSRMAVGVGSRGASDDDL